MRNPSNILSDEIVVGLPRAIQFDEGVTLDPSRAEDRKDFGMFVGIVNGGQPIEFTPAKADLPGSKIPFRVAAATQEIRQTIIDFGGEIFDPSIAF